MDERTMRTRMLLGEHAAYKLAASSVAVFGLGGVGSWCAEALARAGVGRLTIIDMDTVSPTNLNRQLCALASTVGREKTDAMAARLRDAAPGAVIIPVSGRYAAETREDFFAERYDHIADCIDLVSCKLDLIATALERDIPIVSSMGTGNKLDAQRLRLTDISKTSGCPLARVMRRELRARGIAHLDVVWSDEPPISPEPLEAPPEGRRSVPGSVVWVPACAGMLMAQHIVRKLIEIPEGSE